jgi:hypothetical protein
VKLCTLAFSDCSTIIGNKVVLNEHLKVAPAGELNKMA